MLLKLIKDDSGRMSYDGFFKQAKEKIRKDDGKPYTTRGLKNFLGGLINDGEVKIENNDIILTSLGQEWVEMLENLLKRYA